MTDHADTIRPERVERVEQWANLYGNELADILRLDPEDDAATLDAIDDALMLVEDVYAARHERDKERRQAEWEYTRRVEALVRVAQLERALERLAEWNAPNDLASVAAIHNFARAALVKLGEKPPIGSPDAETSEATG